jgi:hypothetical protein
MKVKDLIIKLTNVNQELEVFIDMTTMDMEIFKFSTLYEVDEVETALGEQLVLLTPFDTNSEKYLN